MTKVKTEAYLSSTLLAQNSHKKRKKKLGFQNTFFLPDGSGLLAKMNKIMLLFLGEYIFTRDGSELP